MQQIVLYSHNPSLNIEFYYFKWTQANCGGKVPTWKNVGGKQMSLHPGEGITLLVTSYLSGIKFGYCKTLDYTSHLNPLTLMSDQDRTSPYNINTTSSREVMRIKKLIY